MGEVLSAQGKEMSDIKSNIASPSKMAAMSRHSFNILYMHIIEP